MSEKEYLAFEEKSDTRHEYVRGVVRAMSGGSFRHATVITSAAGALDRQLFDSDCTVTISDVRLRKNEAGNYRYPNIMVTCGEVNYPIDRKDTIDNPTVIIEVLSPSTEIIDRNEKFDEYTALPSVQEYILISQDKPKIERFLRQESGDWLLSVVTDMDDAVSLPSLGCSLALQDVYRKVDFDAADASTSQ